MWDKPGLLDWLWRYLSEELSSFNLKGFYYSYAWSCSLCEGMTSFCTGLISVKLCWFLLMFLAGCTYSVSCLFFLCGSPCLHLCTNFYAISSNIHEVLLINPFSNVLVFWGINVHHKDFPTRIPDCDSHSPALMAFCLSSYASSTIVLVLQCFSLYWKILIMLSQFPLTFRQTQNGIPISSHSLWLFLC